MELVQKLQNPNQAKAQQERFFAPDIANQRGYLVPFLAILLPVLLSVLALLSGFYLTLSVHNSTHTTCRRQLISSQIQVRQVLVDLLDLNPQAQHLRKEYQQALTELKIAIASEIPPAIAAAQSHVRWVRARQIFLQARQQKLLIQARLLIPRQRQVLYENIQRSSHFHLKKFRWKAPWQLAVYPVPQSSITPDYKPKPRFQRLQAMSSFWQTPLSPHLPMFLRSFIPPTLNLQGQCAVTIQKRGSQWDIELTKAKS